MFIKSVLSALSAGMGSAAAVEGYRFWREQLGFDVETGLTLSVAGGTLAFVVLHALMVELPYFNKITRPWLDARARYEGDWIQTVTASGQRKYCIMTISYMPSQGDFHIEALAFDIEGNREATWASDYLGIDADRRALHYDYTCTPNKGGGHPADVFVGKGSIQFLAPSKSSRGPKNGTGFFVNFRNDTTTGDFEIRRITDMERQQAGLTGDEELRGNEERFVAGYHRFLTHPRKEGIAMQSGVDQTT